VFAQNVANFFSVFSAVALFQATEWSENTAAVVAFLIIKTWHTSTSSDFASLLVDALILKFNISLKEASGITN
jgi:hypothetical protein